MSLSSAVRLAALGAGLLLGLAACASPGAPSEAAAPQVFTAAGPYTVGVTTLSLQDRKIEVYYPAAAGAGAGAQPDVYLQTDPLPPMLSALKQRIPETVDLKVTIPAFRDAAGARGKSYPLVVFSHGAGGWRGGHGLLLSGIASWGFVVASVDFTEYGFASLAGPPARDMAARRTSTMTALSGVLDLMEQTNTASGGLLSGMIDTSKIGAMGHSAGGGTMFGAIEEPRIDTVIGWAPVPPQGAGVPGKPTMIIAAREDSGISVASLEAAYTALSSPKRFIVVPRMGHNAFSDACLSIQTGNDLISAVKTMGLPIPGGLLNLAQNGCQPGDLDTRAGWALVQHLSVSQLRASLGVAGASPAIATDLGAGFEGVTFELKESL